MRILVFGLLLLAIGTSALPAAPTKGRAPQRIWNTVPIFSPMRPNLGTETSTSKVGRERIMAVVVEMS